MAAFQSSAVKLNPALPATRSNLSRLPSTRFVCFCKSASPLALLKNASTDSLDISRSLSIHWTIYTGLASRNRLNPPRILTYADQIFLEELACIAAGRLGDLLWRTHGDNLTAAISTLWSYVNQPIGNLDNVRVMLDDR